MQIKRNTFIPCICKIFKPCKNEKDFYVLDAFMLGFMGCILASAFMHQYFECCKGVNDFTVDLNENDI